MAWLSLKFRVEAERADSIGDLLLELGALSVSIEDADAETAQERPIFGEPGEPAPGLWQHNTMAALFDADTDIPAVITAVAERSGASLADYRVESVPEQDWVRATQAQFEPIRIRDDLWIVPSWHEAPVPQALNIVLDPGLAFGTGSHPTTHLCLAWLADHLQPGQSVLDYGCGSGILSIAAKQLGAGTVLGVDIDPQAVQASRENALANRVEVSFALPDEMPACSADIVVANILARPLLVLAPALAGHCRKSGSIVLSGILKPQAEEVRACYSEWFDMDPPQYMEDWVLLCGRKR